MLQCVFGEEYRRYARQVGRAIPRLKPLSERHGRFQWSQVTWNHEHIHALLTVLMATLFGLVMWLT